MRVACVGDLPSELLASLSSLAGRPPLLVASADEALRLPRESRPEIWLSEVLLPGVSGFEFARRMSARAGAPPVLVVTSLKAVWPLARAVRAGARGYLHWPVPIEHLAAALERLLAGGAFRVAPGSTQPDDLLRQQGVLDLPPRRFEALHLMLQGEDAVGMALAMSISPRSAASYRRALERELGIESPADIVRLAALVGAGLYEGLRRPR